MNSVLKLGLIINPVAGMGGKIGLHGTDNELAKLAIAQGAENVSNARAKRALEILAKKKEIINFYSPSGIMGGDLLATLDLAYKQVNTHEANFQESSYQHTQSCAENMLRENVDAILFAGGDGTARDIFSTVSNKIPILGVPSGVKMRSGVFANYPEQAALIIIQAALAKKSGKSIELCDTEILDAGVNSEEYSHSEFFGNAITFKSPNQITNPKVNSNSNQDSALMELAGFLAENLDQDRLYLFGPGQSTKAILERVSPKRAKKFHAGVDAYYAGKIVGEDLNERSIIELLEIYTGKTTAKLPILYLGVIGGQGFLLGRGNQQLSFEVISKIGGNNVYIMANAAKLSQIVPSRLYVDFGEVNHSKIFPEYIKVHVAIDRTLVCKVVFDPMHQRALAV